MLTGNPFCSRPPPKSAATLPSSRWVSESLVNATGCHQRNIGRVDDGGVWKLPADNAGNDFALGPPGSGTGSASAGAAESASDAAAIDAAALRFTAIDPLLLLVYRRRHRRPAVRAARWL